MSKQRLKIESSIKQINEFSEVLKILLEDVVVHNLNKKSFKN